jgi:flagellar assembly factor FliW
MMQADGGDAGVLAFPWGLPGLENHRNFKLMRTPGASPALHLVSLDGDGCALPVVDPWTAFPDYAPSLPYYAFLTLEIPRYEDAALYCVVFPNSGDDATVNLFAPIVINPDARIGRQIMLDGSTYAVRTPMSHGCRQEAPAT